MKTTSNTILITGGGSGIGFEIAKLFAANGNKIIITGRNAGKLKKAADLIPGCSYIRCDVTSDSDVDNLIENLSANFGDINILVNNAGEARLHQLNNPGNGFVNAQAEILTNYLSTIRLTEKVLPLIKNNPEAAIVNVSSILALTPSRSLPTYSASKAALHSYTQVLRLSLENTNVKVFEVMPPLVDTEFSKQIPSPDKISPSQVAEEFYAGFINDIFEMQVASAKDLYRLYTSEPEKALRFINGNV
jgi:uncharacterized oxidoreductase